MEKFKRSLPEDIYDLAALEPLNSDYAEILTCTTHPLVSNIAKKLQVNLSRTGSFAVALPLVADFAGYEQAIWTQALFRSTGRFYFDPEGETQETWSKIDEEIEIVWNNHVAAKLQAYPDEALRRHASWVDGVATINWLRGKNNENIAVIHAIESQLASAMLGYWSSFEAFASDLLIAVLNDGPKKFVDNLVNAKKLMPDSDLATQQQAQINLSTLKDFEYDVLNRMGDLLKDTKRLDFQSLINIKKAYVSAFGDGAKILFDEKDVDYANVVLLSAVRNVIEHKNGEIDAEYVTKMKWTNAASITPLTSLKIKDKMPFKGGFVTAFSASVYIVSKRLLQFVDQELNAAGGPTAKTVP